MNNDFHFSLTTNHGLYEFDLKATVAGSDAITIGTGQYALVPKNEAEREVITRILKEALVTPSQTLESLSLKLRALSYVTNVSATPHTKIAHQVAVTSLTGNSPLQRGGAVGSATIDISSANQAYIKATDNPHESHVSVGILRPRGETVTFRLGKDEDYGAHRIGSVTKMFTTFLALKLVNHGVIRLDSTLGEIIKDESILKGVFADPEKAKKMTLEQLLSHTSGLEYDDHNLPDDPSVKLQTLHERFIHQANLPYRYKHEYATGTGKAVYSNIGFNVAAWMMEVAYNGTKTRETPTVPFSKIMRDELFTKVFKLSEDTRISPGPSGDGDVIQAGCGDMVSSIPDLLKVAQALQKGEEYLSGTFGKNWQKNMLNARGADKSCTYGLGCEANVSSIQFSGLNYEIFADGVGRDVTAHVAFPLQDDQPGIVAMCDSDALGPLDTQVRFRQELRKLAGLSVK
jgi:hypothetical protein